MSRMCVTGLLSVLCLLTVLCSDLDITCTYFEQLSVFTCLNIFLNAHKAEIAAITNSRSCDLQNLSCPVYTTTVECVNGLPLLPDCRATIQHYVNSLMASQNITCTVSILAGYCPSSPAISVHSGVSLPQLDLTVVTLCILLSAYFGTRRWRGTTEHRAEIYLYV